MESDGQELSVAADCEFPESELSKMRFNREDLFYSRLVESLRQCSPHCLYMIRMLESARKDARYHYKGLHPQLESRLLAWRRKKAADTHLPAYYILHQRVLLGIADAAPQSEEELLAVVGFGPGLYARYGAEILALTTSEPLEE